MPRPEAELSAALDRLIAYSLVSPEDVPRSPELAVEETAFSPIGSRLIFSLLAAKLGSA